MPYLFYKNIQTLVKIFQLGYYIDPPCQKVILGVYFFLLLNLFFSRLVLLFLNLHLFFAILPNLVRRHIYHLIFYIFLSFVLWLSLFLSFFLPLFDLSVNQGHLLQYYSPYSAQIAYLYLDSSLDSDNCFVLRNSDLGRMDLHYPC